MGTMVKRGKKYAGQERWENDLLDILRVTSSPRVGEDGNGKRITIGGKPVQFDLVLLLDLMRRRESGVENDGLRSRSYDGGGSGGNSELTQTERAALRGLPDKSRDDEGNPLRDDWSKHVQRDPVGRQLEEAFDHLARLAIEARAFEKKVEVILNADSRAKEEIDKSSFCAACGTLITGAGHDKRRAGYGNCCYFKWKTWSAQMDDDGLDQSHVMFQQQRKAEIDAEKVLESESA